jgi:hypothetical protein
MPIVCDDGPDENAWCDWCDALLYELKDGSMICSNGTCCRVYSPTSVTKHKQKLGPSESPTDSSEPLFMHLGPGYGSYATPKTSVFDKEDRHIASKKSGFHWVEHEDYWPEGNPPI